MSTEEIDLVSAAPVPEEPALEENDRVYVATQWQLMWWKFRRHKLAMISAVVVILSYLVAILCEFIAPYDPNTRLAAFTYAPPQRIHVRDESGRFVAPFVYALGREQDPRTLRWTYKEDRTTRYPLKLFAKGDAYKLWGLWETDRHLLGIEAPAGSKVAFSLLGRDRLGRDMISRVIYGTRVSMSIGLVGVALSLTLGIVLGGFSGYYGGFVDNVIQRTIEFIRSMPTIPLWMALAAAVPPGWPPLRVYFAITVILSLISWTGMARVVRGRFLSLREEDFVMAARLSGSNELRVILRHMVPSFTSHIIASITLSIPGMILSETSLSFLGLGLRPPVVSWGVLLQEAQNVRSVALAPWLLLPGLAVVIAILSFNFLGDGLRDAADPYGR
ncbi:MAG: ABC transporter permease [Chloroflexi bacterium]|nr:ABC transporter permease [Chloroflexota bacterium]